MLKKNETYHVTITDLNNLGFGVCKIDGISVFVADTVTGDEADIRIIKTAKTYAVGTCLRLTSPSPIRSAKEDACPVTRRCGGCVYQNVRYEHELELKRNYVAFAMKKAGAHWVEVKGVLSTGKTAGYRNKAQYPIGRGKDGKTVIGFYAAKTHDIIPAEHCALQPPVFSDIVRFVRNFADTHAISAYDEETGRGVLRHLYLRQAAKTGEVLLCLVINADTLPHADAFTAGVTAAFPEIVSVSVSVNKKDTNVIMGDGVRVLWGKPYMEDILCGKRFRISPMSFYQVNRDGAELLYNTAKSLLALKPGETLLDLYCGIGTIGLSLAEEDTPLVGIEIVPEAIENAKENAARNGMKHAEFFCGDASDAEEILANRDLKADAVVVDPPRKGLTPEVVAYLGALSPARIVYISCDADTLARDIVRFEAAGYHTDAAQPVDMFSRTGHIETVCLLTREITTHEMKLHPEPFAMIKNGEKTIELRLFDEKRQKIKIGDSIVFTETLTGEALTVKVEKLHRFDSFDALYKSLPLLKCGYTEKNVADAKPSDMGKYYPAEEQRKYGVVGIEVGAVIEGDGHN